MTSGNAHKTLALALGAGTGRHSLTVGLSAAILIAGWLVNGFAPLVDATDWLKYLSLFYYYEGQDPLANGLDLGGLVVLGAVTVLLAVLAVAGFERRDLRA